MMFLLTTHIPLNNIYGLQVNWNVYDIKAIITTCTIHKLLSKLIIQWSLNKFISYIHWHTMQSSYNLITCFLGFNHQHDS